MKNRKLKILFAEDEEALGMIVKESLETRDFEVTLVPDGQQAISLYDQIQPDLVILDVMMPKVDGFSAAEAIRKKDKDLPIIFLTSRSRTEDVVEGFGKGGNDYVRKPFSMEELIVRIKELLRRKQQKVVQQEIQLGEYIFNIPRQILTHKKETLELTHRETLLLKKLCENLNEVVDRSEVLKELWGNDDFFNGRSMDVFITKLRKKLQHDPTIKILNVRGFGYKLTI